MNTAVVLVMVTSVAFLGNAVHTLQAADVITFTGAPAGRACRSSWPRPPAYWPTRADRSSPRSSLALVYVARRALRRSCCGPRLAACRRAAPPVDTPPDWPRACASASTSAARSPRRWPSTWPTGEIVASAVVPTTHAADGGVAAGVVDAVAELAAEVGAERDRAGHPLHHPGRERAAGGRRRRGRRDRHGPASRPDAGRASAPGCSDVELAPGKRLRVAPRVLRRHRRAAGTRPRRRARPVPATPVSPRSASPRRSPPTTPRNETAVAAMAAERRSAGVHVDGAERPLRARAAHGHRRAQRLDPADRDAHRGVRRRRRRAPPASPPR